MHHCDSQHITDTKKKARESNLSEVTKQIECLKTYSKISTTSYSNYAGKLRNRDKTRTNVKIRISEKPGSGQNPNFFKQEL